LSNKIDQRCCP